MLLFNRPSSPAAQPIDARAIEILELAASEGINLTVSLDLILWLEDRGFVVDLRTGVAYRVAFNDILAVKPPAFNGVTPSGKAINHLVRPLQPPVETDDFDYEGELEEQIEGRLDNEYHARGGW